ncbi:MAG: phosphoethanolamine--lipid A transferase EptA [Alistipes sp.]|nr:phosphoethanolamine--lipid A transferase EptA [Alistipes sp.]
MVKLFKREIKLTPLCAVISLFTLIAYHYPLFELVVNNIEGGINGVIITGGLGVLMLATNFMMSYIVLYALRGVGRWIVGLSFIADAVTLYFINTYDVLITDAMMGNFFNTRYSEASGFFSWMAVLYMLVLGVLPCIYTVSRKIDYGSAKMFGARVGIALATMVAMVAININNFTWIDRNATQLGSLLMPWSYTVNTVRYYNAEKKRNQKEIALPDATIENTDREVVVLIIGESARRENFSLYGYHKKTNPLLETADITALAATSAATYTTAGVKAILDHKPTDKLYEILPNYLNRTGVDVIWRTNNWGEPPVHIEQYQKVADLKALYPEADERYDAILLEGLAEIIESSSSDKQLIVLHTNTSHGPTYNTKYPAEFEHFTPVCTTVEMAKAVPAELMNAYDNSILYTDYIIYSTIEILRNIESRNCCLLYISDHGESLGENNLYMHGVPMALAPKEQIEIPFIIWSSDKQMRVKKLEDAGHYNIFHTVLDFLDVSSPIYDPQMTVFE